MVIFTSSRSTGSRGEKSTVTSGLPLALVVVVVKEDSGFAIVKLNNNGETKSIINIRINNFEVLLILLLWLFFFDVFDIFSKSVDIFISFFCIFYAF
jgi:hypothetical protein